MNRTAQYDKPITCANCGQTHYAARVDDPMQAFCSDKCRATFHRKETKRLQFFVGSKILAGQMGTSTETVQMLMGENAVAKAMLHQGWKWSSKDSNFKNKKGVLYGQQELLPEPTDEQKQHAAILHEWALKEHHVKSLRQSEVGETLDSQALRELETRGLVDNRGYITTSGQYVLQRIQETEI